RNLSCRTSPWRRYQRPRSLRPLSTRRRPAETVVASRVSSCVEATSRRHLSPVGAGLGPPSSSCLCSGDGIYPDLVGTSPSFHSSPSAVGASHPFAFAALHAPS